MKLQKLGNRMMVQQEIIRLMEEIGDSRNKPMHRQTLTYNKDGTSEQ